MATVRRDQGLPRAGRIPFQLAPVHPPQGTAVPLSKSGGICGTACLRKCEKRWAAALRETALLQTPRAEKKEGEEVLQAPEQRFPCSPWRDLHFSSDFWLISQILISFSGLCLPFSCSMVVFMRTSHPICCGLSAFWRCGVPTEYSGTLH